MPAIDSTLDLRLSKNKMECNAIESLITKILLSHAQTKSWGLELYSLFDFIRRMMVMKA